MSNYDSTPRPAGRIDWTCPDCGRGTFGYSEGDLAFQIDNHAQFCGDPDRGSLGETATVAPFVIDALTEGECPAGGDHKWVTEWPEDFPGTWQQRTHCDECGASLPPADPDDFPGL